MEIIEHTELPAWVSKKPPIYVWEGDRWYNEITKEYYNCNLEKQVWFNDYSVIPFPPKVRIMS